MNLELSLRARLLLSLAIVLTVALAVAGALLGQLTRQSLIERVDRELQTTSTAAGRLQALADTVAVDDLSGRRLALMRLDRRGRIAQAVPSGFASDPDPLPVLPEYPEGIPASALGVVQERSSADGAVQYRVIVEPGRRNVVFAVAAPLTGVEATMQSLTRSLLLVGGLAILIVLAVAWVVVRRDLLPLERIARTARAISQGDLSHRSNVAHDSTEVGRLGAAFDTMLDRVEAGFGEQQAALRAKELTEQQLRRFVADASHELRTPLTAVRGYADLYRAGGLRNQDELDAAMQRIGTESRRMGALVDDLLLLGRLDQGRPLRREPVDLSIVVRDAVADARAVEPARPIADQVEPGIVVTGDEDRLRQVVGNLLANVRVHTTPGTPVEISVRRDGSGAELRVADHGPGIDSRDGGNVFDRFYRADPARARDRGGTGLGLAIAAAIVAAQDGTIWHEPTPGGGATFVVRLPLTASSQSLPRSVPADRATIEP